MTQFREFWKFISGDWWGLFCRYQLVWAQGFLNHFWVLDLILPLYTAKNQNQNNPIQIYWKVYQQKKMKIFR